MTTSAVDSNCQVASLLEVDPNEGELVVGDSNRSHKCRSAGGALVGLLLLAGVLALAGRTRSSRELQPGVTLASMLDLEEVAVCSPPGENCAQSKCCMDGGAKGFQCYQKNDDFGECFEVGGCKPGVHKGEKNGVWNAQGKFVLDEWSCKTLGEHSRPGCDSYEEDSCPDGRCIWKTDTCAAKCATITGGDACWQTGYCMWADGQCADACWEIMEEETCSSLPRCMWFNDPKGARCSIACDVHAAEKECPSEEQCMWVDGQCSKDPCSAQWEDCRETKCCSAARGAIGMTCTEKNKDYATCIEMFDPKYQKNWTGKALGERTKFQAGCTWAGKDCSNTHMCCNEGFNCLKKDDTFAGCALTMKISTWMKTNVPPPEGWDGTVLGGWRGEYEVQAAPEGSDMAGTSFYCFMAVLPDSPEMDLMEVAKKNNASVFGCDASSVYHSWKTDGEDWDTGATTLVNTAVFLKVMQWMKADGIYLKHDWTIKVDADCVFVPQRLREHMWALRPPPNAQLYMKNNDLKGLGNNGFLGAIEVFSKKAVQVYLDNDEACGKYLGTNSGEDGFFKGCMDALGAGFVFDGQMFEPNYDPAICTNGEHAAFHPIKYPSHWQRCWDIATGKMCKGDTFDCGDDLDPPVNKDFTR